MAKEILRQRAWNAGELDPDLVGRDDVKVSANGAAIIENCLCVPQGPLYPRPGQPYVDIVRHPMVAIDLSGATLAAPEGGTAADALAADGTALLTTTDLGVIDGYVVLTIDFGAPVTVHAVDAVDYGLHDTTGGGGGTPPDTVPITYPWGAGIPGDLGGPGIPGDWWM